MIDCSDIITDEYSILSEEIKHSLDDEDRLRDKVDAARDNFDITAAEAANLHRRITKVFYPLHESQ